MESERLLNWVDQGFQDVGARFLSRPGCTHGDLGCFPSSAGQLSPVETPTLAGLPLDNPADGNSKGARTASMAKHRFANRLVPDLPGDNVGMRRPRPAGSPLHNAGRSG